MRTPVSLHKKIISSLALIALVVLFGMTGTAEAQRLSNVTGRRHELRPSKIPME